MKKRKLIYFSGIVIMLLLAIYLNGGLTKVEYPDDFNFTYTFGANGKESIDTYKNILTYDSIDGLLELEFKLSKEEKNRIYLKMVVNAFMSSPNSFPIVSIWTIDPIGRSTLKSEFSGSENHVSWSTYNIDLTNLEDPTRGNRDLTAVQEIGALIEQIILEKTKSMNLPEKNLYL